MKVSAYCCGPLYGQTSVPENNYIEADPLFVSGPLGDYYLSQVASGQEYNSPCLNAGFGNPEDMGLRAHTTRTDGWIDIGIIDIGFHYPTDMGDINQDGKVNMLEFGVMSEQWQQDNRWVPEHYELGWWRFDEGDGNDFVNDSSGNDFTGIMHGMDEVYSWKHGIDGTAVKFHGVDEYIELPYVLNPAEGPFTVSVWVIGQSVGPVISQINEDGTGRKWLSFDGPGNRLVTKLQDSEVGGGLDADHDFQIYRWYHVVFVWDGEIRRLYVDGQGSFAESSGDFWLYGSLMNMSLAAWVDDGRFGKALQFDGINDYVVTPNVVNPSLGLFSAFMWVKGEGAGQRILSQGDGDGYGYSWLVSEAETGYLKTKLNGEGYSGFSSNFVCTDGQWHHVGIVWDGQKRHLYGDGVKVASDAQLLTGAFYDCNGEMLIGASKGFELELMWEGMIDDVRIYDFALNGQQVHQIHQGETAVFTEYLCSESLYMDFNSDCVVDFHDFLLLTSRWLE